MSLVGQILPDTAFGKVLTELSRESDMTVELGTWHGEGSTRCIANGLIYPEQRFITIEQDPTVHAGAKARYDDSRINFINGHALDVVDQLPEKIDLILFDGSDLTTEEEFAALAPRATVVALDDTMELKNRKQRQEILNSPEWIVTHDFPKDRYGWMVARKKNEYDKIYEKGGWDGLGSGPGSTLGFTLGFRISLSNFITNNNIKRTLDYGCGDGKWQAFTDWDNSRYVGWDKSWIAAQLAKKEFMDDPEMFAFVGDPFERPHRIQKADLLIVKDVIHHATFEERLRIVEMSKQFPFVLWVVDMDPDGRPCYWPTKELPKWELFHKFDTTLENYRYGPKSAFLQRNG